MPLYEYRKNAENAVSLSAKDLNQIVVGRKDVAEALVAGLVKSAGRSRGGSLALDGWYGVDWSAAIGSLKRAARAAGIEVEWVSTSELFKDADVIADYRKPYVSDDPSFGWVNDSGTLDDLLDEDKLKALKSRLKEVHAAAGRFMVVYGPGAIGPGLEKSFSYTAYCDYTMQPMLWQMWGGKLVPFGRTDADTTYFWKQYYYCDFYLLLRQKKRVFPFLDYYVEAVDVSAPKGMPMAVCNRLIDELVKKPIKQVKITQPGPWGSYRFKEIYDPIPGLENMAWNELAGIELSILVDCDLPKKALINMPCQNAMQRPVQMVGKYIHKKYPDLLPLQVWLDDGYFKDPVPYERGSMPIHNHPDTAYNRRNFNEPLGRYETYYIVEAYHDAGTMMGFLEEADLEEYERLCRESNNQKVFDWQKYVKRWATNVGDLFLIPPGTEHGHGGNQMILEMDTGPSVAGTEYSFFTYDFARHTWDDKAKSMTAPPMRMHIDHSFKNNKWRRENYVKDKLRARPVVVTGDGNTRMDRYTSIAEMPFEIERFVFTKPMAHSTDGRFLQIPTLAVGKQVIIRSRSNPKLETSLDFLQACLIPAGFGDYEFISPDGSEITVVMIRLKKA